MRYFNFFKKSDLNNKLIFILGCPRGGTTWLWSILESHKDVKPFLLNYQKRNGNYLSSESGIYAKDAKNAKKKIIRFAKNNRDKFIIEKTPLHTLKYEVIKQDFPEAKFILIFRNPLAIVSSMVNSNMVAFQNYDIIKSINEVKKYYNHLIKIPKTNNTFILTYENLYDYSEFEIIKLFEFLELEKTDIKRIIKENYKTSKVSVKGAFRKASTDSYLTDLAPNDIKLAKKDLRKEIIYFNNL